MSGNFAIKGGGVGRLMANAILNFHFDYLNPSLSDLVIIPATTVILENAVSSSILGKRCYEFLCCWGRGLWSSGGQVGQVSREEEVSAR